MEKFDTFFKILRRCAHILLLLNFVVIKIKNFVMGFVQMNPPIRTLFPRTYFRFMMLPTVQISNNLPHMFFGRMIFFFMVFAGPRWFVRKLFRKFFFLQTFPVFVIHCIWLDVAMTVQLFSHKKLSAMSIPGCVDHWIIIPFGQSTEKEFTCY